MNTPIQRFIEKAIEGGWKFDEHEDTVAAMLLDPEAWKAVGKVAGWNGKPCNCGGKIVDSSGLGKSHFPYQCQDCSSYLLAMEWEGTWRYRMHGMIDALADGRSIEEYLAEIV